MPDLTDEEKKILRQAYEIKERLRAEELEAGEISVEDAERQSRADAAASLRRLREEQKLKEEQAARAKAAHEARLKAAEEAVRQKAANERQRQAQSASGANGKSIQGQGKESRGADTRNFSQNAAAQTQAGDSRGLSQNAAAQTQAGDSRGLSQNAAAQTHSGDSRGLSQNTAAQTHAGDSRGLFQNTAAQTYTNGSRGFSQNSSLEAQRRREGSEAASQSRSAIAYAGDKADNRVRMQNGSSSQGAVFSRNGVANAQKNTAANTGGSKAAASGNVRTGQSAGSGKGEQTVGNKSTADANKKQQDGRQRTALEDERLKKQQEELKRKQQALAQKKEAEEQRRERKRQREERAELKRTKNELKQEKKALKKGIPSQQKSEKAEPRKKAGILGKILKILAIMCIALAILAAGVYVFLRKTISMTNYFPYETSYVTDMSSVLHESGVRNILLIGLDTRTAGEDRNSDAMIIVSINSRKRRIVMTSIMRDSYVNIPGRGMNRINSAYTYGGAALLVQTIEENYRIAIDNYVKVDFFSFVDVVDALGGVTVDVQQKEVQYIDGYISEYNHILGLSDKDGFVDELFPGGEINLTGKQALGYVRIRYGDKDGEDYDFGRTRRQRIVMNAIVEKVKKSNPITLYNAVEAILPDLTTDIDDNEMCLLIMKSLIYLTYDMQQARCPANGTYTNTKTESGQEVLSVDFEANKSYLKSTIYD